MPQLYTKKALRDKVLAIAAEVGAEGLTKTLVNDALDDAHDERCTSEDWNFMLWKTPEYVSVTAGTKYYSLHPMFSRPYFFWNMTDEEWVKEVPTSQLAASQINITGDSGPVRYLQFNGRSPVQYQPPTDSVLTVASSSPGDGAAQTVTVIGDTAAGVRKETIACDSTGSVSFRHILKVRKDGTWDGDMTLASPTLTLLTLPVDEVGYSFPQIWLPSSPDTAVEIAYRFYRNPIRMVEDNDIPDIPPPFENILVYDTLFLLAGTLNPTPAEFKAWKDQQERILFNMRRASAEAMALETLPTFTTYIPR